MYKLEYGLSLNAKHFAESAKILFLFSKPDTKLLPK